MKTLLLYLVLAGIPATISSTLPGTRSFDLPKDWQEQQQRQIVTWYEREIARTPETRSLAWNRISPAQHRENLRQLLGLATYREGQASVRLLAEHREVRIDEVTLPVEAGLSARALMFTPASGRAHSAVIAVPSESETAEAFAGVIESARPGPAQWLRSLLANGAVVLVPGMVERTADYPLAEKLHGMDRRHLLYRLGFVVGRSLPGLEVEQVLALTAFLARQPAVDPARIAVLGAGQGGMTALYAAALDERLHTAAVIDYFDRREQCWSEPVDRMLYGQLKEFGDAELAALLAPRRLVVVNSAASPVAASSLRAEIERAGRYHANAAVVSDAGDALLAAANALVAGTADAAVEIDYRATAAEVEKARNAHFESLHQYLLKLVQDSDDVRTAHWRLAATAAAQRDAKAGELRRELSRLIGAPDAAGETGPGANTGRPKGGGVPSAPQATAPLDPRTRLIRVTDKFIAYDVMLGVLDGVEAYGQLLVPRVPGRRLPAVICQHGLDGQPGDITGLKEKPAAPYHSFGAKLAEEGYVVFAPYVTVPVPQVTLVNPMVRLAASVGAMRTGMELAKLRRILDFLDTLAFVDRARIGYYGLSYGGYSAIWMAPLEPRLRAIVISGHFNDWRSKITDEQAPISFLFHPDEDFYNWRVLDRFTHTELIAAMWPRPVMVEFADRDSTTTPEWHERAWSRVLDFSRVWHAEDQIARDRFHGVHEVAGIGTFAFLDRWLRPEMASRRQYQYLLPSSPISRGIGDASDDTLPYIRHNLDGGAGSALRGTFHVSRDYPEFSGVSLKMSRVGNPGDVIVRFGTRQGSADLGEARIRAAAIHPLYDLWYAARVPARKLDAGRLYHIEIRAENGAEPLDCYIVYGPRRLGGTAWEHEFAFAYHVLDNSPPPDRKVEDTHEFVRAYLDPGHGGERIPRTNVRPAAGEIEISRAWSIRIPADADDVLRTAERSLREFFPAALGISPASSGGPQIRLETVPSGVAGVNTAEGFQITAAPSGIDVRATTSRGVMRGVYWIEDALRLRQGPYLKPGTIVRNERFPRRITTSILPGAERYTETTRPMVYTDGLLEKISRDGFNAVWVWLNTEEAAMNSAIFPELDDPNAAVHLARLDDLSRRALRYGIDVYVYLASGYDFDNRINDSFYRKYPDARGYGSKDARLCTSNERVRRFYTETVGNLFRRAPALKGLVVIYDSEGFYYCGSSERGRAACPRCKSHPPEELAHQVLTTLNDAMHAAGGPSKELIAYNYGRTTGSWVRKLIPLLPKDISWQIDFSKGGIVERDGIRHETGDYNLTLIGPPDEFVEQFQAVHAAGLRFITKTEHAVSQEFIFVPYIPAMEQWYRRVARIRDFDSQGWFGNWCHYGYMASLPAQLINRMSFDPVPAKDQVLDELARRNYGEASAPDVLRAWNYFSDGIRLFPYSDRVVRTPGPLQKGPSHPFWLDPKTPSFGPWRSWQNDLKWTAPWGPVVARKYLALVKEQFGLGIAALADAQRRAVEPYRSAIASEWRVARTIESSLQTVVNLIDWLTARDEYYAAKAAEPRARAAARLEEIALAEREHARGILPILESDSRLGYASEGGGLVRGGLFTAELVRWKLGQLDDLLARQLPALTGRAAPAVPATVENIGPRMSSGTFANLRWCCNNIQNPETLTTGYDKTQQ